MEIETLYDLKKFLNSLTGEQLGQKIKAWGNGISVKIINSVEINEFDLINPSGEFLEPIFLYKDEPSIIEEELVIVKKGEIIFQLIENK